MPPTPPLLYLGYVGLTIPFAFAMGALLSGRTDERWIVVTRRWTLAAWTFLGVCQLVGSHLAYVRVGWGGYYAVEPVRDAALQSWLGAGAFLDAALVAGKGGPRTIWHTGLVAAWRRASLRALGKTFIFPAVTAIVTGVTLIALGFGSSTPGLLAYTFGAFVAASIALEFVRGTRARRALSGGSWFAALGELVARNRRRYGGYVVHASILMLAIGIAGSSAYHTRRERRLHPGPPLGGAGHTPPSP